MFNIIIKKFREIKFCIKIDGKHEKVIKYGDVTVIAIDMKPDKEQLFNIINKNLTLKIKGTTEDEVGWHH